MKFGDIVIASFPFTDNISFKARPAVIIGAEFDEYNDVVVCMISSVVSDKINEFQILISPSNTNGLRALSVIKIYKIATIENEKIIATIGKLSSDELIQFKNKFKELADK